MAIETRQIILSEADIKSHFGSFIAYKGQHYFKDGRVVDFKCLRAKDQYSSDLVLGKVQGTRRTPYLVEIALDPESGGILCADCSCPLESDCKHCAAVLYELIKTGNTEGDKAIRTVGMIETRTKDTVGFSPDTKYLSSQLTNTNSEARGNIGKKAIDRLASIRSLADEMNPKRHIECLLYILQDCPGSPSSNVNRPSISLAVGRRNQNGAFRIVRTGSSFTTVASGTTAYIREEDKEIAQLFLQARSVDNRFPENPVLSNYLLHKIVETGRCIWKSESETMPLSLAAARPGSIYWKTFQDGSQELVVSVSKDPHSKAFLLSKWFYVDTVSHLIGSLTLPVPDKFLKDFAHVKVTPDEAKEIYVELSKLPYKLPLPMPNVDIKTEKVHKPSTPVLKLQTIDVGYASSERHLSHLGYSGSATVALLCFDYDGTRFDGTTNEQQKLLGNRLIITKRHKTSESQYQQPLIDAGMVHLPMGRTLCEENAIPFGYLPDQNDEWFGFTHHVVPRLKEQGWDIQIDSSFQYAVVDAEEEWESDVQAGSAWWFSLKLGITVDGKQISLFPILSMALASLSSNEPADLEQLNKGGYFYASLPDGRQLALPFERVQAILKILIELSDRDLLDKDGALKVSLPQACALMDSPALQNLHWQDNLQLKELAAKLRAFAGVQTIEEPEGFNGTLRNYQKDGLGWLQFHAEHSMGGILADDMGLGKTLQTLAHVLKEKREKRLASPCLVISPTSVVRNWEAEAKRFTPELKTLCLHGSQRSSHFEKIPDADLVLTTYPLLLRDHEALAPVHWHLLILDEAQAIKNPDSKVALYSSTLKANHRVCLTGTPIQNHLGDLWSQFNFLMPGLLGDKRTFRKLFRTPIEKLHNQARQQLLANRLRPFILRRTKEEVAKELPEKTTMVRYLQLERDQRDLYETVRLAMHEKVKEALRQKGMSKCQIIILDALLKLRQVCCDPRLVKLAQAAKVKNTAKLSSLKELLVELLEENRRILLFSQFTSMLDLIAADLELADMAYVELRGDTIDRVTPIARFQSHEVPLFLISLKAGGTGLNLTAADTVIHYDPWWNPAVEDQATDRAHRIGQTKPVLVIKLICQGTIEERMLQLQERKRIIAQGIYDDNQSLPLSFTEEDLEFLFSPLEATVPQL